MNIIITGASRGIGYALATAFASNLSNTIIVVARNGNALNELASLHKNIIPIVGSIDSDNIHNVVREIGIHFNHIDILINNAGHLINKPFLETTQNDWQQLLYINTIAPAMLVQQLFYLMGGGKHSHIINIGSMGGYQGSVKFPGLSAYSASKSALANLTECLAEEFKENNITINCLALGAVQTEMLDNAFPGYKASLLPDQLASFVVDFAETGHRFFNGKILPLSVTTP